MIKRLVSSLVLSCALSTALAQQTDALGNLIDPPGDDVTLQLLAWVRGGNETAGYHYFETHVRFDDNDVYFLNICPTAQTDTWVKGSFISNDTIRILPQVYYTEATEVGNYTTHLVLWHGNRVGYDQPGTEADHYDLVVGYDDMEMLTITCADKNDWLSVADKAQQGIYDFSSELVYTTMADEPDTEIIDQQPAGRYQRYTMQGNFMPEDDNDLWADFGYKADIVWGDDGKVYFSTLTPDNTQASGWIVGDYDAASKTISVETNQCVGKLSSGDYYIYLVNYDLEKMQPRNTPLRFQVNEQGWIYATDEAEEQYVATLYRQGSLTLGLAAVNQYLTLFPVNEEPTQVPATLNPTNYAMHYQEAFNGEQSTLIGVAFEGNDIYIKGISKEMPNEWIKGSIDGNKATFPSHQLLESPASNRYLYFNGARFSQEDEIPVTVDALVMTYNANDGTLSAKLSEDRKEADYITVTYAGDLYTNVESEEMYNIQMIPQTEWTPATPAAPSFDVECHMTDEQPYITFYIPNTDVNGAYLEPSSLYYRLFMNLDKEDIYTFRAENYIYLGEDVTLMPYNYSDGFDISANGTKHVVYLYPDEPYDYISLQSVYIYEGVEYESDIISRNYGPYVPPTDGIESLEEHKQPAASYNIFGQRVKGTSHGLIISNKHIYYHE